MAHLAAELPFDTRDPAIALVLRGAGRVSGQQQRQVAPLRSAMVADILTQLGTSPRDLRDGAVIALGYCFARRRSELAGLDHERLGGGDGWLTSADRTLEIHLTRAKAMTGSEAEVYVVPRTRNHLAANAIGKWITAANVAPGEPLLRRVYKSGRIASARLDPQSISLILKSRVAEYFERQGLGAAEAARQARNYSGHSLRVGFAVTSVEAGASIVAIQRALGHRTPMMAALYARKAELARLSPHLLEGVAPKRPTRKRRRKGRPS